MSALPRIRLRALEMSDLELLYHVENDPALTTCTTGMLPLSRAALKQFIQRSLHDDIYAQRQLRLVVEAIDLAPTRSTPISVGLIDLFDFSIEHGRAEVGLVIFAPHRGQGFGTAALEALSALVHRQLSLTQLYAYVQVSNEASARLFRAAQFACTACLPAWFRHQGHTEDAYLFQRILSANAMA